MPRLTAADATWWRAAQQCSRPGAAADRATVGDASIARPGHHAAPVAVKVAKAAMVMTSHHGMLNASMRYPTARDIRGASPIQPTTPTAAPAIAETIPVTNPDATIVDRRCFSVAPTADIIPSCGSRR